MRAARFGVTAVVALMLGALQLHPASAAATAGTDSTVSVIVVLDPGVDVASTTATLARQHGGRAAHVYDRVLGGFAFVGSSDAAAALAQAPGVRAVLPDQVFKLADVAGTGFFRIGANVSVNDPQGPYRGAGARIAVIDSGIDINHRDLAPNLDLIHSYNCIQPGAAPNDDNGHGTHVAGIAAAAFNSDGYGIVGVAPSAKIVALKAFDASGNGTTGQIVCALNKLAALTAASPMPTALNMSFADEGTDSVCGDGDRSDALHEAMCDVVNAGAANGVPVIPIAAAGNASVDAATTIPAAFHDVIAVSALADHDGAPGGTAGCPFVAGEFNFECDDTLAAFSNWGAVVDVAAPGVEIYSDVPGGFDYLSGTSMAAPHVTGVVALMLGANPALDFATARTMLLQTGECPDGSEAGSDASCAGQGQWQQTANQSIFDPVETKPDPDGTPEPLVNAASAARAAAATGPADAAPSVSINSPVPGATVSAITTISGTASDDHGVTQVDVRVDGVSIGTTTPDVSGAWSINWNTTASGDGPHNLTAVATDSIGQTTTSGTVAVTVSNTASASSMHVGALSAASAPGKRWTASATVQVVDNAGAAVSGATVSFTLTAGNKVSTLSCVTGSDGRCTVRTKVAVASVRFVVKSIAKTGLTYDASANVATEVTATKP